MNYGTTFCQDCKEPLVKTGCNQKRCDACKKANSLKYQRSYQHIYAIKSGRIKKPFVGSGNAVEKGPAHPAYKTGLGYYKQLRKDKCKECGSDKYLLVHHRDHDRSNQDPDNLQTLCKRCHQIEHKCWENFNKGQHANA